MALLGTMGKDTCDKCGKSLGVHGTFLISDDKGAQVFCQRYLCRFKRWLKKKVTDASIRLL